MVLWFSEKMSTSSHQMMLTPSPWRPASPPCASGRASRCWGTPPPRRAGQSRCPPRSRSSCASSSCDPSPRPSWSSASCPSSSCDYPPDRSRHPRHSIGIFGVFGDYHLCYYVYKNYNLHWALEAHRNRWTALPQVHCPPGPLLLLKGIRKLVFSNILDI